MSRTRRRAAIALLAATGLAACTDDDEAAHPTSVVSAAATTVATTTGGPTPATTDDADIDAAFEFAHCMRSNGIAGFADPQIRPDGDYFLEPPADVSDEDLAAAEQVCLHILGPPNSTDRDTAPDPDGTDAVWERVVPGGDCQCADGSAFSFWVRTANPAKVVFYLQDGGACFSAETCADRDLFHAAVTQDPTDEGGIFDLGDARNPFADYTMLYVPYCTGDAHLGNTTTEYAPGLIIEHKGYLNATAALDHLAANFPHATAVAVVGESAGSIAAPLYGGLVSDRLPDARITVLADGSGSYPDVFRINEIVAAWGFRNPDPTWPDNSDHPADAKGIPGLFIQSGRHDPDIVFARHDYADDENQHSWYALAGIPAPNLLSLIDANETQIEAAGVSLLSYIAPGDEHTALSDGTFYDETVNGVKLLDWVTSLIEGEPVDDVHCTDCTPH